MGEPASRSWYPIWTKINWNYREEHHGFLASLTHPTYNLPAQLFGNC